MVQPFGPSGMAYMESSALDTALQKAFRRLVDPWTLMRAYGTHATLFRGNLYVVTFSFHLSLLHLEGLRKAF